VKIRVEFEEYKIKNGFEKGPPAILLLLCKTHGLPQETHGPCVSYCLSLASLSSELGLCVFMKVVDMDVSFH